MIDSLLIANRGEIACRILRTARRLSIRTVAVFSAADAQAWHVDQADEARHIGAAPARDSYLNGERIIEAAKRHEVQAIHPGYGFLAENAAFARECDKAGLIFVGPPAAAIEAMGSKIRAKEIMAQAGVPLIPGYHGPQQQLEQLREQAREIGYPLLIKASAGGGGKGMRVVADDGEFATALAAARRESLAAFGDDQMLLEKYLSHPRHIEIQVFCDTHGHAVHLFERECSLQRRHQKVIEEAPAPQLDPDTRAAMGTAAVCAARAIDYVGAGTVEFMLDDQGFYFMEMNTRLQVEHPVTEYITGHDLVEWQLHVAAGGALPATQDALRINGHAIEARIYAEDVDQGFLPTTGRLQHLRFPATSEGVRIDSGVRQGDSVGVYYDPMIAKLIVWDRERDGARERLLDALAQTELVGLKSNVGFLRRIADHAAFAGGRYDTGFIDQHLDDLLPPPPSVSSEDVALVCLFELLARERAATGRAQHHGDPFSPWHAVNGWRLNEDNHHRFEFLVGHEHIEAVVHFRDDGFTVEHGGSEMHAAGSLSDDNVLLATVAGERLRCRVIDAGAGVLTLVQRGRQIGLRRYDPLHADDHDLDSDTLVVAPMPGRIASLSVTPGQKVQRGAALVSMEAMKMEHTISAGADATVKQVLCHPGQLVEEGAQLIVFEE